MWTALATLTPTDERVYDAMGARMAHQGYISPTGDASPLRRFKRKREYMSTDPAVARESKAAELYLPAVERELQPGIYKALIESARSQGTEYSKNLGSLRVFRESFTPNLSRFTEGVLRKPASISPAMRELIAASTSFLNECRFCTKAHGGRGRRVTG